MKKLLIAFSLSLLVIHSSAQINFRSNITGNIAQNISHYGMSVDRFNAVSYSNDTIMIRLYNFIPYTFTTGTVTTTVSAPTYTNTPSGTYKLPPQQEAFFAVPNNPINNVYKNSCFIRTSVKGFGTYTTTADPHGVDSYTVVPAIPPTIEIEYH